MECHNVWNHTALVEVFFALSKLFWVFFKVNKQQTIIELVTRIVFAYFHVFLENCVNLVKIILKEWNTFYHNCFYQNNLPVRFTNIVKHNFYTLFFLPALLFNTKQILYNKPYCGPDVTAVCLGNHFSIYTNKIQQITSKFITNYFQWQKGSIQIQVLSF